MRKRKIGLEERIVIDKDIVYKKFGNTILFLDRKRRKLYELNNTASFIWSKADGKMSINDIINRLTSKYNVARTKEVEKDVLEFIEEGISKGIFKIVDA